MENLVSHVPALVVRDCAGMSRSVLVDQAAQLLGVSRRTVYYRIREGKLQTVRTFGSQRVLLESIEALVRSEREGVTAPGAGASGTAPFVKCPAPGPRLPLGRDVPEVRP